MALPALLFGARAKGPDAGVLNRPFLVVFFALVTTIVVVTVSLLLSLLPSP